MPIPRPQDLNREPLSRRWLRRAASISVVLAGGVALSGLIAPLLLLALGLDLARRRRLSLSRCLLGLWLVLLCEALAVLYCFVVWVVTLRFLGRGQARFLLLNNDLQARWCSALYRIGAAIFGVRTVVEGPVPPPASGPLMVLVRHASTADTLLPGMLLGRGAGFALRFVLKRELLLDPCLDIVGHRLPNCFVRRGGAQTTEEVARVVHLLSGLTERDALVIFPEGTRFTERRRAEALRRLGERGPSQALALAGELRHTLSPLRQGALALLRENPGADLLFIGHTGLEPAGTLRQVLAGSLIGAVVRVRLWRVPYAEVPRDEAGQAELLGRMWRQVDQMVG